jgi:hypothetical protein
MIKQYHSTLTVALTTLLDVCPEGEDTVSVTPDDDFKDEEKDGDDGDGTEDSDGDDGTNGDDIDRTDEDDDDGNDEV